MHAQSIPWLHFSLRVKGELVTVAYEGPAESLLPPTLFISCYSPRVLSAPATLGSLHFFPAGYICFRAFALLLAISRKLLIRYYLGPLPHFLHTFDQCHHLSEAMSRIFPFLSDLFLLYFSPHDILLHWLIFCWSPSTIYAT